MIWNFGFKKKEVHFISASLWAGFIPLGLATAPGFLSFQLLNQKEKRAPLSWVQSERAWEGIPGWFGLRPAHRDGSQN